MRTFEVKKDVCSLDRGWFVMVEGGYLYADGVVRGAANMTIDGATAFWPNESQAYFAGRKWARMADDKRKGDEFLDRGQAAFHALTSAPPNPLEVSDGKEVVLTIKPDGTVTGNVLEAMKSIQKNASIDVLPILGALAILSANCK